MGEKKPYEGWAIVELMGHRRLGGVVSEEVVAGVPMLRIDVPAVGGAGWSATQYYGGGAIYALTPTTEVMARAVAATNQPAPVQRWELPQLASARAPDQGIEEAETDDDPDWDAEEEAEVP
jgi:hypothetical protein